MICKYLLDRRGLHKKRVVIPQHFFNALVVTCRVQGRIILHNFKDFLVSRVRGFLWNVYTVLYLFNRVFNRTNGWHALGKSLVRVH